MSSCCTLRLKRRRAFSRDSPSCSRISANQTHPQTRPVGPNSYYKDLTGSQVRRVKNVAEQPKRRPGRRDGRVPHPFAKVRGIPRFAKTAKHGAPFVVLVRAAQQVASFSEDQFQAQLDLAGGEGGVGLQEILRGLLVVGGVRNSVNGCAVIGERSGFGG